MTKQNEEYDLVINGGRAMDLESGLDAVLADRKIDALFQRQT